MGVIALEWASGRALAAPSRFYAVSSVIVQCSDTAAIFR